MNTITIKPHHFIDIIKLYGTGIEVFVPDEKMGHDFYRVANSLIDNPHQSIQLTIGMDDICRPCRMCENKHCIDSFNLIFGFHSKEAYNQLLDKRILSYYHLNLDKTYSGYELCTILFEKHHLIYDVWQEENQMLTKKRYDFFKIGSYKYLNLMDDDII